MTYPPKPAAAYDYVTFQAGSPTTPLPANQVAADYANHKTAIDAIVEFLKVIARSDGNLQNGSVRPETLSSGTLSLISAGANSFKGAWLTATAYAVNNIVAQSGNNYICLIAHTSGVFATDLAAGKWQLVDAGAARLNVAQAFIAANDFTGGSIDVPTAAIGDNDTSAASTAFVQASVGKAYTQVFTATGTYTPHAGMVNCVIECWGGGGGGGGAANSAAGVQWVAGGGGAGSYSRKVSNAAAVGASKAVTIGAAGAAGTSGANAGGAGGDTSVGALCVGKGGSGGAGAAGGAAAFTAVNGGAGGVAGTGDVTSTGAPGLPGAVATSSSVQGAGVGGSSLVGGGGFVGTTQGAGVAGSGRGSGGSGGITSNAGGAVAGGLGTAGYVVITEFCNQ